MRELISYHVVTPADLNSYNTTFGGKLASWVDESAMILAQKFTSRKCVTVTLNMVFKEPSTVNNILEFRSTVVECGNTSFKIKVDIVHHNIIICTANLKFVALDENNKPTANWDHDLGEVKDGSNSSS